MIFRMSVLILSLVVGASAMAQGSKKAAPAPSQTTTAFPVYSGSSNQKEISGQVGMVAGALNLGATFIMKKSDDYGWGGYFFYQTSKDKNNTPVVSQVMSLGGLFKVNVINNSSVRAYMAPGFGFSQIKEGSVNVTTGNKSDETLISPIFKMGVQMKASSVTWGLERTHFSNWLNDSLNNYAGPAEYTAISLSFDL